VDYHFLNFNEIIHNRKTIYSPLAKQDYYEKLIEEFEEDN